MKKYRVIGTTVVTVYKEVWANSEDDAIEKANNELYELTMYCGNGGWDKLIGVDGDDEGIEDSGTIDWESTDELEDDPNRLECPYCGEECDVVEEGVWWCDDCEKYFNENCDEIDYEEEEEEEDYEDDEN